MENIFERFIAMMEDEGYSEAEILTEVRRLVSISFTTEPKLEPRQTQSVYTDEEKKIIRLLRQFGIPTGIKGYQYLIEAICLYRQNPKQSYAKELYSAIAKKFGTTRLAVERAIRHAIERGCDYCEYEAVKEIFGNSISIHKGNPTNGEFITRMSEQMDLL